MKRRPNFSSSEMDTLIDGVAASREIVANACPGRISKAIKEREWQLITSRVNSTGTLHRTVSEVRKKWKNLRMVTKAKKEALMTELGQVCHGADPNEALKQLTPAECRVIEILEGAAAVTVVDVELMEHSTPTADKPADFSVLNHENRQISVEDYEASSVEEKDERPLVIDRSEIILTRQLTSQPSLPLMPTPPSLPATAATATKPSILTVVETLQRRLLAETTAPPTISEPALSAADKSHQQHRRCCCCSCCRWRRSSRSDVEHGDDHPDQTEALERRLLRVEERRLRVERDKLAALRDIVASLRQISASLRSPGDQTVAKDAATCRCNLML